MLEDYLAIPDEQPIQETADERTQRLHDWITTTVNTSQGEVLFTWGRLKQEVLPAWRKGKANAVVHRTLNEMRVVETPDWEKVLEHVDCIGYYQQGLMLLRQINVTHAVLAINGRVLTILESLCNEAAFVREVREPKLRYYANNIPNIASVKKQEPSPSKWKKPQRPVKATARYAIPVTQSWKSVG
jgi:hypothetical protein